MRGEGDRRIELLNERPYEPHAEALGLGQIEIRRQPDTLVAHRDAKRFALARDTDPDLAARSTRISVFRRIRYEFVDHQRQRDGAIGLDHDVVLRFDEDFAVRDTLIDITTDHLDIAPDIEVLDVLGLVEALVGASHGLHPMGGGLKLIRRGQAGRFPRDCSRSMLLTIDRLFLMRWFISFSRT